MTEEKLKPEDSMWIIKHRPKKISGMVGDFKDKILKYLENPSSTPHFLFYSKAAGTGKTTLSLAIINELGCDKLILNSSDDRKIETIRAKVKDFSMAKSTKQGLRKCVFLDEFDGMLKASQEALRNVMETYAKNVFFILTCNNVNKVIAPLQSRCKMIEFSRPNKDEVKLYLESICKNENLEYNEEGLKSLIDMKYPSIRNCVMILQDLYTQGLSVIPENIKPNNSDFDKMWNFLKEKKWFEVKKYIMGTTVNPQEFNSYLWEKAINMKTPNIKFIQITCRNEKDIAWGADAKIIVTTSLIELCKVLE